MYVARPLSGYIKNPDALSLFPDGPNSGIMVIQDEDSETYCCFGLLKNRTLRDLPFPQNKALTIRYKHGHGEHTYVSLNDVMLIPVLNLPLSSNRYYAIKPHGNHKGEAFTCSKDEDMRDCCFFRCVKDIKPKPFDEADIYQQFEVHEHNPPCVCRGHFYAKSVAPDGYAPCFLRRKGWSMRTKTPNKYKLEEASGLNASLRARQPGTSEAVVVGKWYAPFIFVKEGILRDQVKNSPFYEATLEQKWEQIFSSRNDGSDEGKSVSVDVTLDRELVYVAGNKAVWDERSVVEGAIWFTSHGKAGEEAKVGLAVELVHRMKWEQERGGWTNGEKERLVNVKRWEKFEGNGVWREFGCYVLVESFVLKRMDGSVILTYDFKHTEHVKSVWE